MYGFTIYNGIRPQLFNNNSIEFGDILCVNNMIAKFDKDKLFNQTDNYIIILDGLILNKKELQGDSTWLDAVIKLYETQGDTFFNSFRGCFSGAIYDKKRNRWIVFTDQLGQKFMYYALVNNTFVCSSMVGNIYNVFKDNGIEYHLSEDSAMILLTFGFMLKDLTLSEEVKKIQPGCYIVYENNAVKEINYFTLDNTPNYNRSTDETIEQLDDLFLKAVKLQFEKDKEYGYNHICALSAGLDSRMTVFVAHELGYEEQTNFTFSQSDYWDDIIPKAMAKDLRHEWIFKSLDDAKWLMSADTITKVTGGQGYYQGSAHGNSLFESINWSKYGMIHSGQMGDVVPSCKPKSNDEKYEIGDGACFKNYLDDLRHVLGAGFSYPNKEIGFWYCRCLNGTNIGQQNLYNYSETFSPFTDLDFLTYCLSIPCALRYDHKLYKQWIIRKHPKAADYGWEKIGGRKISDRTVSFMGKEIILNTIPSRALQRIKSTLGIRKAVTNQHMNPISYYISQYEDLRHYIDTYFQYLDKIDNDRIKTIVGNIMKNGSGGEKLQALSLLSAIKVYF